MRQSHASTVVPPLIQHDTFWQWRNSPLREGDGNAAVFHMILAGTALAVAARRRRPTRSADWWETAHRYWLAGQGVPGPLSPDAVRAADPRHAGDVRGGQCDRPALPELSRMCRQADRSASQDAAAATAAYQVLLKHYPANKAALDESYTLEHGADRRRRGGRGRQGDRRASRRGGDGRGRQSTPRSLQMPYRPRTVPGEWVATALAVARSLLGGAEAVGDPQRRRAAPAAAAGADQRALCPRL